MIGPGTSSIVGRRFFLLGCVLELALAALALLLGRWLDVPIASRVRPDWGDVMTGVAAALPPAVLFLITIHSPAGPLRLIRHSLVKVARPLLAGWSIPQIAVVSCLAGLSEELFFRGLIQGGLTPLVGVAGAVFIASAVFGLVHWLDPAYVVGAALIGAYLSGLWWWTDNLLTPVVTHAVYDFIALVYLLRVYRG
jgi:hypothetical protein